MILGTCHRDFGPAKILVQGIKFLENWSAWTSGLGTQLRQPNFV